MSMMKIKTLTIKSLSPSGHGIALNNWQILGAFPGDVIRAQEYKVAQGISYAEILEIVTASPYRNTAPTEAPFFDPHAPWRYLDKEQENKEKRTLVQKIFNEAHIKIHSDIIQPGEATSHYRNKAAYAFTTDAQNNITFALFTRGISTSGKISQEEHILVHPTLNTISKQFLVFFNQKNVALEDLKYLVLRYSYHTDSVVGHILVTQQKRKALPWKKSDLETLLKQHNKLDGILVSHSEAHVRSTTVSKDFYQLGTINVKERLCGKTYTYHPSQFFQIYPEAFSVILKDCENLISTIPHHQNYELLDLFAGIGIIGLHLAHLVNTVHGVEQSPLAKKYAQMNAREHKVRNFSFTEANVDDALDHLKPHQILFVDPARSGLTKKSLTRIRAIQPRYLIYLSCNPETQARDINQLRDFYDIRWSRAYNLFPKTPHIEHLVFLIRKY